MKRAKWGVFFLMVMGAPGAVALENASATEASANVEAAAPKAGAVKYKAGKDINFEELLIEGAVKRPELGVVTGDQDQETDGLLRLRENFIDRMTVDASEEIQ